MFPISQRKRINWIIQRYKRNIYSTIKTVEENELTHAIMSRTDQKLNALNLVHTFEIFHHEPVHELSLIHI